MTVTEMSSGMGGLADVMSGRGSTKSSIRDPAPALLWFPCQRGLGK